MGWLIVLALALIAGGALWKWGKLPRSAFEPVGAALLLGLAGYALQGSPNLPDKPVQSPESVAKFDEKQAETRAQMGQRFGSGPQWLVAADGAMRAGVPQAAVTYIKSGLKENPRDPDLWVGLGNALIVHNGGMVSPAATYAFQRAADIAPNHPGPPFFMGLAMAQSGQFAQARAIWTELLARAPADAPWRADLEARLAQLPS
ncbi:cytochrome C biogenesis protein [Sphingomonas sp. ID1715]|uniref:tetratricopeptide repeat protein n=1 Tax=Sphingomonas sp. ID1715 TaxID=1656898 RepID=UPI001489B0AF|nr:cytochrome C biogenesis protein [Sphingomonas sp. ID1715]